MVQGDREPLHGDPQGPAVPATSTAEPQEHDVSAQAHVQEEQDASARAHVQEEHDGPEAQVLEDAPLSKNAQKKAAKLKR